MATVVLAVIQRRAKSSAENIVQSYADDYIRENAEFREEAGLKCYLTRYNSGKCCPWCDKLAGRYDYETAPEDIFQRHDNCDCVVTYENGRMRQDVWSKKQWQVPGDDVPTGEPIRLSRDEGRAIEQEQLKKSQKSGKKGIDKSQESGIIKLGIDISTISSTISTPIEQRHTGKGNPNAILLFDVPLNNRQKKLLEELPSFDSRKVVPKKSVSMTDLAALTAKTGDEFAMFTKGNERLIIRGNSRKVNININEALELARQGYRWSGHTHPGIDELSLIASDGDTAILKCFNQKQSVIYNSKGKHATFNKEE